MTFARRRLTLLVLVGGALPLPLMLPLPLPQALPQARAEDTAADAAAKPPIDFESPLAHAWLREDWFGIYCGDVRIGWMRRSLTRAPFGGVDAVVREVEMRLDVAGDGNEVGSLTRTAFRADGDQAFLGARVEHTEQARSVVRDVVSRGARFDVVTERRGTRIEGAVPAARLSLSDDLGIERLAALAAQRPEGPQGAAVTVAEINFGTFAAGTRKLVVKSALPPEEGRPQVFELTSGTGRAVESLRVDANGAVLEGSLGARFRYRVEPREVATDPATRQSLEALSRVPLDGKLGAPALIRKLVLAWDDAQGRVFPAGARQTVRAEGKSLVVEIVRDAAGAAADDASTRDALTDEPALGLAEPLLGRAAAEILSGTADRGPQVARLLAFTSTRIENAVVLGTPTAVEILQRPRGDCTEHVLVFIALCRVSGIPARAVAGLSWMGDEAGTFGWHQWAEVALGGRWVPVDPTLGANPAPATNIVVDASPEARTLLWGARLRLVSAERDDPPPAFPPPRPPQ